MREVIITSFYKDLTRKAAFSKGWSWLKFNNLGLTLGTKLRFYTSVRKGLKLRVREFCGLIPTFVGVTGEKLVRGGGGDFLLASPPPLDIECYFTCGANQTYGKTPQSYKIL